MKGWMTRFKAVMALTVMALILSGCGEPFLSTLQPSGEGAAMLLELIILSTVIMLFVFVVVMAIYIYVIIKFRQKKGQEDFIPKQTEGSHALETLWTVIPIILLLILAVPTVQYTFAFADVNTPEVSEEGEELDQIWIDVTGKQYWWHFEYEGLDITTSQEIYIPTDRRVYLSMISDDVIHSFWVPSIQGKMDVNPTGNRNEMWLQADEEGVYWGKCAELCGPSHSLMDFKVIAVSPGEFEEWVEDMQGVTGEEEPETATAQAGQEIYEENCLSCHAVGSSPNKVGPNLTNFADRDKLAGVFDMTEENLFEWIDTKGEEMKPGNLMVDAPYDLNEEEINQVIEYLMTLSPSDVTPESADNGVYIDSDLSDLFPEEEEDADEESEEDDEVDEDEETDEETDENDEE
ncbi:cytochrome c oxidase subunit II [Alkalibacillus haloalkaliphilus]|uniref:cytochrome c oxidase subunit II n=1 Tax=Alkalibacillus haloalkaliphilus TaxID=94136 RepID=UPI00293565A5|nr:cytochrome c oxidase subunit II [Alkalibacillus haloalkaliphilus]MDV2582263.1 cytochrome c oxidase subunit II [Alkalibacillus haloalkaliphilus]